MSFLAFTRVRHDATAASIEARATWRRLEVEVGPLVGTTPDVSPPPLLVSVPDVSLALPIDALDVDAAADLEPDRDVPSGRTR